VGPHQPSGPELLDGGESSTLLTTIREGGSPLGEQAFEHGLRALLDGTAATLARAVRR
jgi:TetR/AcrR family tetracycline transcriptional repressor